MATRTFKRDARGRFAAVESRGKKRPDKLTLEAQRAAEELRELKQERAVQKTTDQVESAESAVAAAERAYRQAKKLGGDAALESAWATRLRAHQRLAAALKRRATAGR